MTSVLFKFDPTTDTVLVAGMINHQNGNGSGKSSSGLYSFIRTRAFSPTRFGLYYSDLADCSATVLSIVDVTPAGDMQLFGPEFVIAPPSVNMVLGVCWLGQLAYPDIYNDYDMVEVAQEYYKLFWNYDMSDEEAKEMLANSYFK